MSWAWPLSAGMMQGPVLVSAMYLTNVQRLALHLEGTPDPSLAVVQAAVTKTGYAGYVCPEFKAAAPAAASGGGSGGTSGGSGTGTGGGGTRP